MSDLLSQFRVNQLIPEGREGTLTYQLSDDSVSPTRVVMGPDGIPVEETICALAKSALFVDPAGNICTVALRTGRILSNEAEAERYELIVTKDLILQGQLPLASCPHTLEYRHITRGPLVPLPAGVEACNGAPDATNDKNCCPHMQQIITARRAKYRVEFDKQQRQYATKSDDEVKAIASAMMQGVAAEFGQAIAQHVGGGPKANRSNMRDGRGEQG